MAPTRITTVEELAHHVSIIDASTGAERHAAFGAFSFELDMPKLHALHPMSDDYRNEVLRIYRYIHQKSYSVDSESQVEIFNPLNPSPYSSNSPAVVGQQMGAISTIVRDFPAVPPGLILDVGTGWGHTAEMLARTGFVVHGFDINESYLQILDSSARKHGISDRVKTIHSTFEDIGSLSDKYDVIMFYEAFHHALDHSKLIDDCLSILKPDGALLFAGEPIYPEWPVPWSLRTDSLSSYCIHKFGWMELGFSEDYFVRLLYEKGLYVDHRTYIDPLLRIVLSRDVGAL